MQAVANDEVERASYPVPINLQKEFFEIQKFVFGREDLIQIKTCHNCRAVSDANRMTIYVDLQFFKSISPKEASFVLSHEVSHFIFDYMTLLSEDGLSPNGNIPLLRKTFMDYVDKAAYIEMQPEAQFAEIHRYFLLATSSHAEVDLIAILVQEKMGRNLIPSAKELLLSIVNTSTDEAKIDAELRFKSLKRLFPKNK